MRPATTLLITALCMGSAHATQVTDKPSADGIYQAQLPSNTRFANTPQDYQVRFNKNQVCYIEPNDLETLKRAEAILGAVKKITWNESIASLQGRTNLGNCMSHRGISIPVAGFKALLESKLPGLAPDGVYRFEGNPSYWVAFDKDKYCALKGNDHTNLDNVQEIFGPTKTDNYLDFEYRRTYLQWCSTSPVFSAFLKSNLPPLAADGLYQTDTVSYPNRTRNYWALFDKKYCQLKPSDLQTRAKLEAVLGGIKKRLDTNFFRGRTNLHNCIAPDGSNKPIPELASVLQTGNPTSLKPKMGTVYKDMGVYRASANPARHPDGVYSVADNNEKARLFLYDADRFCVIEDGYSTFFDLLDDKGAFAQRTISSEKYETLKNFRFNDQSCGKTEHYWRWVADAQLSQKVIRKPSGLSGDKTSFYSLVTDRTAGLIADSVNGKVIDTSNVALPDGVYLARETVGELLSSWSAKAVSTKIKPALSKNETYILFDGNKVCRKEGKLAEDDIRYSIAIGRIFKAISIQHRQSKKIDPKSASNDGAIKPILYTKEKAGLLKKGRKDLGECSLNHRDKASEDALVMSINKSFYIWLNTYNKIPARLSILFGEPLFYDGQNDNSVLELKADTLRSRVLYQPSDEHYLGNEFHTGSITSNLAKADLINSLLSRFKISTDPEVVIFSAHEASSPDYFRFHREELLTLAKAVKEVDTRKFDLFQGTMTRGYSDSNPYRLTLALRRSIWMNIHAFSRELDNQYFGKIDDGSLTLYKKYLSTTKPYSATSALGHVLNANSLARKLSEAVADHDYILSNAKGWGRPPGLNDIRNRETEIANNIGWFYALKYRNRFSHHIRPSTYRCKSLKMEAGGDAACRTLLKELIAFRKTYALKSNPYNSRLKYYLSAYQK